MDALYKAMSLYRRYETKKCADICTVILENSPHDKAAWCLKLHALNLQIYCDEFEVEEEEDIADLLMDENSIAQIARPGTSLKAPKSSQGTSHFRSNRPFSGRTSASSQHGSISTLEQAMQTRNTKTCRPVSASSGRYVHIGTASMLPHSDGYFINLAVLNVSKYAAVATIAKPLFEYIYFHGHDLRQALEVGSQATHACCYSDWWWKFQLGKCYYRLGMFRDSEKQLKSAVRHQDVIDLYLWLGKVYLRLDQPLTALEVYKQACCKYPHESLFIIQMSRIYEDLNDSELALKYYKDVLRFDATDVEATACIAMSHFYADQPEIAVRYYRRLLQMGICSGELYNNLALCCFYSQQYDMAVMCFERALLMTPKESLADIWYNISHLSIGVGDRRLASQCYKLALVQNNSHAESYNNLGVIEASNRNFGQAEAFFFSSAATALQLLEPFYNQALVASQIGDVQSEYSMLKNVLHLHVSHTESIDLLEKLNKCFLSM